MKMPKSLVVVLFLILASSAMAVAQSSPSQFITVYTITVNPGAVGQFEGYIKKIKEGAEKIGAPQTWGTSQIAFGGPGNTYLIVLQFDKWSELDGWKQVPELLEEAYGADEAAKILRSGNMAIASSETSIGRLLPDLSYNVDSLTLAPMYQIRVNHVKRDMQDEYRGVVAKLNEAWDKAGDGRHVIRRVSVLGPSTIYTSAIPMEKWADRDDQGNFWDMIEKAHGANETRRLRETLEASVAESELFVITVRPDLSRSSTADTSN